MAASPTTEANLSAAATPEEVTRIGNKSAGAMIPRQLMYKEDGQPSKKSWYKLLVVLLIIILLLLFFSRFLPNKRSYSRKIPFVV